MAEQTASLCVSAVGRSRANLGADISEQELTNITVHPGNLLRLPELDIET